jgi:hypothetical protein
MNWFITTQLKSELVKLGKTKQQKGFILTASSPPAASAELDWKNQADSRTEIGNFQRYVCDSHTIKIFLTKTSKKWAVSLVTNHTYLGTLGWSIFWEFKLENTKEAQGVFKEVCSIADNIVQDFVDKEKPTVLLHSVLRSRLKNLDREDVIRTNIPFINYSYDIPYEEDWRKTIYGPRYPTYKEDSFKEYLNSSVYSKDGGPTGKFAL